MSKKVINKLKARTRDCEYSYLRAAKEKSEQDWNSSGNTTYTDLIIEPDLTINGQEITKKSIKDLYSKHKDLILQDENGGKNYRLFLKAVFTEVFVHAGATIPNNPIMEELITYYNRSGYKEFFSFQNQALHPFGLRMYSVHLLIPSYREKTCMSCEDPNCLKFSFSVNDGIYNNNGDLVCDLQNSVEFQLKCEGENVRYEEGKVSLTIPKELKNYRVSGNNLFNVIIEYFQKFCEKFGFKFETKVDHNLDEPLKVLSDVNATQDKNLNLNNSK